MSEFNFHELKTNNRLPSPSGTALAIMKLLQQDDATTDDLAKFVQADPALTSRVLNLANSSAMGVRRPIVRIVDAVVTVGMNAICQFALSLSLVGKNQQGSCQNFDYKWYWSLSLAKAVAIQVIIGLEKTVPPGESFTVGLLSNIGQLALATAWPEKYSECLKQQGNELRTLEQAQFSIAKDELTVMLLKDWGFPNVFLDALSLRSPEKTKSKKRSERFAQQLAFAEQLAIYILSDREKRELLFRSIVDESKEHDFNKDSIKQLLDEVEILWHQWGKQIGVETAVQQQIPVEKVEQKKKDNKGLIILLVTDDQTKNKQLSKQLIDIGHHVLTTQQGDKALEIMTEKDIQLVLIDCQIKSLNGKKLCETIRTNAFSKSTYIIMLTSIENEDAILKAFDAGIDDYLIKPVSIKILEARIKAGQRVIQLQQEVIEERQSIERYIAELAVSNRRLNSMANTDLLTCIPNRRSGLDKLEKEWNQQKMSNYPLSIMILDLDHFKRINDTLGHASGDKVLIHVAHLMRKAIRATDFVCRMGGEEFLIITPNTSDTTATRLAERVRSAIEKKQLKELGLPVPVTVSIGVACSIMINTSWEDLVHAADQALYQVKNSQRNAIKLYQ